MENNTPTMVKWEVVKNEPYRFIGKSFYGRMGKCDEFCAVAKKLNWVYETLDDLAEYATDDIYDAALVHWEKWDEKNKLMGYTVGRFMKADTPVPEDMDYIDMPEGYMAKCFIKGGNENIAIDMLREEIKQQGIYKDIFLMEGEIFPDRAAWLNDESGVYNFGAYLAVELLNPSQE